MKEIEINKLPQWVRLKNGAILKLSSYNKKNGLHSGIKGLSDIEWYEYKITNNVELNIPYDNISLSLFCVDNTLRVESAKNIVKKNISLEGTIRPNIDYSSGNIHPTKEYIESLPNKNVKQLVLCKGLGPNCYIESEDENNYYCYKNTKRERGCWVNKSCYYPLIIEDDSSHDWRHDMLKNLWDILSITANIQNNCYNIIKKLKNK